MNFEELKSRDLKDLRLLAAQYGIPTHHRQKPETIAKLIVEFVANKPSGDAMKHPAEQPVKSEEVKFNTEDEIRETLKNILIKPGFTITFPGDDTWIVKCRGAEESGHVSVPLRWIKIKAEAVSRGAINPRGLKDNQLNPTANSGLVLMV